MLSLLLATNLLTATYSPVWAGGTVDGTVDFTQGVAEVAVLYREIGLTEADLSAQKCEEGKKYSEDAGTHDPALSLCATLTAIESAQLPIERQRTGAPAPAESSWSGTFQNVYRLINSEVSRLNDPSPAGPTRRPYDAAIDQYFWMNFLNKAGSRSIRFVPSRKYKAIVPERVQIAFERPPDALQREWATALAELIRFGHRRKLAVSSALPEPFKVRFNLQYGTYADDKSKIEALPLDYPAIYGPEPKGPVSEAAAVEALLGKREWVGTVTVPLDADIHPGARIYLPNYGMIVIPRARVNQERGR